MFVKGLRKFLYAGALLALAPIMARAEGDQEGKKPEVIAAPPATTVAPAPAAASPCGTPCAPTTCKVKVCVWVDEPFECTRTVYKPVTKEECYTAYRCETVTVQKTRQVTEYQKVCETVNECRTIVKKVPVWVDKVEYVTKWNCVQVTEMVNKTHYSHHWECVEVPSLFHSCKASCDPCNPCGSCCTPCTRTVKKLVVDKCCECVPVCRTKMVKECVPVCKKVCTYQCVTETCTVPVTRVKCVPVCKTVCYTECQKVMVPYQAKRCVTCCVPCTEVVKGCRKVATWVEKEIAVTPCDTCCAASACCGSHFGGLRGRFGCHSKCSSGCGSACGVAASCCGGCN